MKKKILHTFRKAKAIRRKYYATGLGTFLINLIFKKILFLYKNDFLLHFTSRVNSPNKIEILNWDSNHTVHLSLASSSGCYYQAINGIRFGEGTLWAPNVSFISSNHDFKDLKKHTKNDPISIGNQVWIGANSVLLPSINIGDYCVIGAGSVVTKSFPAYSIIAGNPAKIIGYRCKKCLTKLDKEIDFCKNCS